MATTESDRRHQLHIKLDEVIGVDNASTLMDGLTTRDYLDLRLSAQDAYMEARFDALERNLGADIDLKIERAMREVERSILLRMTAILTLIITVQTVLGAIVRN